jgi:Leucine-rich repeat (LRR) protein
MKTFKINNYITAKLENNETVIYIAGELFRQCKKLLLIIKKDDLQTYEDITSIDDIADQFKKKNISDKELKISPKAEFIAHCSNLQAWAENNYDTRLLHRNLAFSLLQELTKKGDPTALRVLKEEIAKRLDEGVSNVTNFLVEEDLISYLNNEELLFCVLTPEEAGLIQDIELEIKNDLKLVNELDERTKVFIVEKKRVVILDLTSSNISEIPIEITKLKNLRELWLGNNNIADLPKELLNLKKLKKLILSGNDLKEIPDWVVDMEKIEGLYLSDNPLSKLPEEIGLLKSLKELELNNCKISSLPDSFYDLGNLTILNLKDNKLKETPEGVQKLKKLKKRILK